MDVKVFDNDTEAGKYAFDLIKQGMDNGAKVLGLATGSTPVTMYQAMVNSDVDFSNMTSVNLMNTWVCHQTMTKVTITS